MKINKFPALLFLLFIFLLLQASVCIAAPVRIMPLGDSITGSPGCWRAFLWKDLTDNGFTDIDFVGTQSPQGCAFPYDGEHEGHGGALVTNVAANSDLVGWLTAANPDIILMHFGTNDVWSNRSTQQILDAYTTLVNQMRQNNAEMTILVAQIIPVAPDSCPECPQRTTSLNDAIPTWARDLSTSQSPIIVVDHWSGFNPASDTYDGVHPNDDGIRKVADNWYGPLVDVLADSAFAPQDPACTPSVITPNIQVDDDDGSQTGTVIVDEGHNVILSPQSPDDGLWSWNGPNGFSALTRQVTFADIQLFQEGLYTVTFTNSCNATSQYTFEISVGPTPEEPQQDEQELDQEEQEPEQDDEQEEESESSSRWPWQGGCDWQ